MLAEGSDGGTAVGVGILSYNSPLGADDCSASRPAHPYSKSDFAESLNHIGEPIWVAEWGTTVLRRNCGMGYHDAVGTYPIAVFKPDCDLAGGLQRLARLGMVSIVLVMDDVLRPQLVDLQRTFDFVRPFKLHYLYDRTVSPPLYSKHHRYELRGARAVRAERFDLAARLDEWTGLYEGLIARLDLANTAHAFPRGHHEALARLAGVVSIGGFIDSRLASCHVWVCHGEHAMSHLAASNEEGYASNAAYAVNAASIELLSECRTLNFGGGPGTGNDEAAGLARFKRGFSNTTAPSYLCGKVLAAVPYAELSQRAGISKDAAYFPAYRQQVP